MCSKQQKGVDLTFKLPHHGAHNAEHCSTPTQKIFIVLLSKRGLEDFSSPLNCIPLTARPEISPILWPEVF